MPADGFRAHRVAIVASPMAHRGKII